MRAQNHIIQKQTLDIRLRSREQAFEMQNRVRDIYLGKILPLLEKICSESTDEHTILRLDKLELDLGAIPLEDLESGLLEKFSRQFRELISNQSPALPPIIRGEEPEAKTVSVEHSELELLSFFLETGTLPWWAKQVAELSMEEIFSKHIRQSPQAISQLIRKNLSNEIFMERLIYLLNDRHLTELVQLFEISSAKKIMRDYQAIISLLQKAMADYGIIKEELRLFYWQSVFASFAVENKTPEETKITEQLLRQMAEQANLSFEQTLAAVATASFSANQLPESFRQLIRENFSNEIFIRQLVTKYKERQVLDLIHTLYPETAKAITVYYGEITLLLDTIINDFSITEPELRVMVWQAILSSLPEAEKAIFDETLVAEKIFWQIAYHANVSLDKVIAETTKNFVAIKQIEKKFLSTLPFVIEKMQQRIPASGKRKKAVHDFLPEKKSAIKKLSAPENTSQDISPAKKGTAGLRPEKEIEKSLLPRDESTKLSKKSNLQPDTLYVSNAGLVIVGLYLPAYFSKLQLTKDGQFVNKAAKQRAAHLLQFVATGEQKFSEHLLVLNKLLCGMKIAETVPSAFKIKAEEKKETESMLRYIIKNWSVLKTTSVNGLRETFLKRDGVLSTQDNGWLLRVERKAYDVLLDTIPWNISTVKLPWSKDIIYSEW